MAGFVIHLAVAEEYIKKHNNINSYNDFIKGIIAPDLVSDKSLTHYGEKSSKVNLKKYLEKNKVDNDYEKGYFLHLLTDYLFYNKYLDFFSKEIYDDYDITNKDLIEYYKVVIPDKIKKNILFKEGKTKVMSINLAKKVIDEVSSVNIIDVINDINNNSNNWTKIKKLEHR